jgi:hypothetical protein
VIVTPLAEAPLGGRRPGGGEPGPAPGRESEPDAGRPGERLGQQVPERRSQRPFAPVLESVDRRADNLAELHRLPRPVEGRVQGPALGASRDAGPGGAAATAAGERQTRNPAGARAAEPAADAATASDAQFRVEQIGEGTHSGDANRWR